VIVVDANVVCVALYDDGDAGRAVRTRLHEDDLIAPQLIDLEVVSTLRRRSQAGVLSVRRASEAVEDLTEMPIIRLPHAPLLPRCWELRSNLTTYDAAYVAAAEMLGVGLLTGDRRLARSPGPRCPIEVLDAS